MSDNPIKTAWEMSEGEKGVNLWEMAGIGFNPLPPVLRQKFIQTHHTRKDSFASIIRRVAETMLPGEDQAFGPLPDEETTKKALGRIRNVLTRHVRWPEGYTAGTVVDDEGHWYASFMRGWRIPIREDEE